MMGLHACQRVWYKSLYCQKSFLCRYYPQHHSIRSLSYGEEDWVPNKVCGSGRRGTGVLETLGK